VDTGITVCNPAESGPGVAIYICEQTGAFKEVEVCAVRVIFRCVLHWSLHKAHSPCRAFRASHLRYACRDIDERDSSSTIRPRNTIS
jgi:hypothetical protein